MSVLGSRDGREIVLEIENLREEGILERSPRWRPHTASGMDTA
jgi:hypothetical protein